MNITMLLLQIQSAKMASVGIIIQMEEETGRQQKKGQNLISLDSGEGCSEIDAQEFYVVKRIVKKRKGKDNTDQYQIEWTGYPKLKDYTWEPVANLENVMDLVTAFNQKSQMEKESAQNERKGKISKKEKKNEKMSEKKKEKQSMKSEEYHALKDEDNLEGTPSKRRKQEEDTFSLKILSLDINNINFHEMKTKIELSNSLQPSEEVETTIKQVLPIDRNNEIFDFLVKEYVKLKTRQVSN